MPGGECPCICYTRMLSPTLQLTLCTSTRTHHPPPTCQSPLQHLNSYRLYPVAQRLVHGAKPTHPKQPPAAIGPPGKLNFCMRMCMGVMCG